MPARAQLDDYKAAERERESKRDRSARERAQDDGAQAAQRKKAKRDQLEAEEAAAAVAAAKPACRAVQCQLQARAQVSPSIPNGRYRQERVAAAERAWQERVREGRFVLLRVAPSHDLRHVIGEHIHGARNRGRGRPRNDGADRTQAFKEWL